MIGMTIAIAGPGSVSVDNGLGWDTALDGGVGAALVLGALGAAAAQLALFFKPSAT